MNEVTRILHSIGTGEAKAAEELLPLVYAELRKLAASKMAREVPGQTLQPTALVHEAWLRLVGNGNQNWDGRVHFFAAAAEAMRRILIENARRKQSLKRSGGGQRTELDESRIAQAVTSDEVLAVHEALDGLAKADPAAADLVKLRFFVGLTMVEAAEALDVPLRTAERLWTYGRAWLRREMKRNF